MTVGFRIYPNPKQKVSTALVERYRALPVANVSDSMSRMNAAGPRLRPMHGGGVLAGPAITVKSRPGDNLMLHKALDMAEPGDIVVVDAGGDLSNALIGEMMIAHAERRGLGGVVINGSVRDAAAIRAGRFPIFAAGVTHRGPYKDGPGEINVAIAIDGMVIHPGDLMLGDDDGLVCVPIADAEAVFAAAKKKHDAETTQLAAIAAGRNDRSWVDEELKKRGVEHMG
ncbi:methyltransferase [Bradyrhizobium sp. SSBR45G]|uniref:RraA family protein n=1 Tax=unclassified Bradyrhizobium TaxID=2631580 RepID=UPI0023428C40|nr:MULTISPECIES: RraA family protein [unclassified Bradyrhizobium]GLH75539.1 methyltransferase [Bradyrhizobium sp. SSBR45G]GLH82674.1 methyltransferase [Bradyrhizobium sp. SSBR45R]